MKFEPVLVLDAVKAVLVLLAATGVVFLDEVAQQAVVGAVGAALTLWATLATRARVTPVSRPSHRQ